MTGLFDVVEVNLATHKVSVIAKAVDKRNAEAVVKMAVARRGVNEWFFVDVPAGTYRDGEDWAGTGHSAHAKAERAAAEGKVE